MLQQINSSICTSFSALTSATGVSCFIHSIQLAIIDGILSQRAVADIISKGRKIVGHFKHSSQACTNMKKLQESLNAPTHQLVQDVTTRWNSTYLMLERLYEQRKVVTAYAAEHDIPTLAAYQWTLIENILRVLKPFFEMTEGASKEFEKISFVIPATSILMSYLSKRQKDEGVQTLKE